MYKIVIIGAVIFVKKPNYIGDPVNTVRIFNELEVDELCFLDIRASLQNRKPNFEILKQISNECFMPLSYGGGIVDKETALEILTIGFEKVVINSGALTNPNLISDISAHSGNQSVICSIDVKKSIFGKYQVFTHDGTKKCKLNPLDWATELEDMGAGELLITSMNRDGTWEGFDLEIVKSISEHVNIPVIANGGAGNIGDIGKVIHEGKADAVGLGSMVVYQSKGMGVLVNFPDKTKIENVLSDPNG